MDCLRPVSRWNKPTTHQPSLVIEQHPRLKTPLQQIHEHSVAVNVTRALIQASLSSQRLGPSDRVVAVAKAAAEVANAPWETRADRG